MLIKGEEYNPWINIVKTIFLRIFVKIKYLLNFEFLSYPTIKI